MTVIWPFIPPIVAGIAFVISFIAYRTWKKEFEPRRRRRWQRVNSFFGAIAGIGISITVALWLFIAIIWLVKNVWEFV